MHNTELSYYEWEKNLWKKYKTVFPDAEYTITDGVVSPKNYCNADIKILFLNREPYDGEKTEYSLNGALREQIENEQKIFPHQTWFCKNLQDELAMFNLLHKDITTLTESDADHEKGLWDRDRFQKAFKSVAYVNVKKSDGQNPSNISNLADYCKRGTDILKEQISFFNPTLIVGGNVVNGILNKADICWDNDLYANPGILNIKQIIINNKSYPLLDTFHPSAHTYNGKSMSDYYLEIFKALQNVEKEHPGYFKKRMNQKCFI